MKSLQWRPSDPGRFALRNALRAAIVIPVSLVIGRAIGDDQTALFAVFGSISTLIFADFGGPPLARLVAYLSLTAAGLVLIVIGTLCSMTLALAAIVMALVGFVVLFAGVINGYLAAAGSAALLSYILPVMVPADASEIPHRLLGFATAGCLAIPATMLLFPKRPRDRLRLVVADACHAVAGFLAEPTEESQAGAAAALEAVHRQFASTPFRPTGPTGATGSLAVLIDELDWLGSFRSLSTRSRPRAVCSDSELELINLSVKALECSARMLSGTSLEPPDEEVLERRRRGVVDEVLALTADPTVRDDDERLWSAILGAWEARVISYMVGDVARHAVIAGGMAETADGGPAWLAFIRRQSVALSASGRLILAHADVRSVWFRNSLRGATGLAIAVLLGQLVSLQHAFWAVLGSLSVLRSSALSTGTTIVRAVIGTTAGIVIGGALLVALGSNRALLWVVLPFACLLAAYAPRAISFTAGQAGFTVVVFIVFDLIVPTGWKVGLIRLEDVAIGFAISLLVGLLFWPRGASAVLRASFATAFATGARFAVAAMNGVVSRGDEDEIAALSAETTAAQDRLDSAFRQRLAERPSDDPRVAELSSLLTATARIRRAAVAEQALARMVGDAPRPPAAARLIDVGDALADWYDEFGRAFVARRPIPRSDELDPHEHGAMLESIRQTAAEERPARVAALACAWVGLHIDQLRRLEQRVAQAAETIDQLRRDEAAPAEAATEAVAKVGAA